MLLKLAFYFWIQLIKRHDLQKNTSSALGSESQVHHPLFINLLTPQ